MGNWIEGLSRTSIGRFGGMADGVVPYDNGYLTASATDTHVWAQIDYDDAVDLGHFLVPDEHGVSSKASWTGIRYDFTSGGKPHSVVTRSLLFPGFHHRVRTGAFEYYWRIKNFGATDLVLPLKGGLKHVPGTRGYDRARDGELAKPWVLFYFSTSNMPFDYPMLLVFDRRPENVEVWTHEFIKVHFKSTLSTGSGRRSGDATVVMVHPFGAERLDKAKTAEWSKGMPDDVIQKLDFWAAAALAYPSGCRETFRVNERRGTVTIRNEFRYEESKSEWGVKPLHLAPLPPVLALAREAGYPVRVKGKLIEKLCPTYFGWYEAVRGKAIEYELPLSRFRDHALAPVRIANDPAADELQAKLATCLESGAYMTFGGDDHYAPECSLDSLHDLRIMGWATWSLTPEKRAKVFPLLTRGLKDFSNGDYLAFKTPATGTEWVRHRTIFDYKGVIDYDMEWYNGMNLAGLWAYDAYGPEGEGLAFAKKHWPFIRKIFNYFPAYTDWAMPVAWTCCRGEGCWLDGINYSYEGLLGYSSLARKLGEKKDAAWADYLAAKMEAHVWTCWQAGEYFHRLFPKGDAEPLVVGGFFENRPALYGDDTGWSCGVLSYLVREVFMLLKDLGKAKPLAEAFSRFEKNFPEWKRDPYRYGKASGYPGSDFRRTVHHYFLDPRLMVRAIVLDEGAGALKDLGVVATAPVLECCLVGMAPMVLAPREARFLGSEWDAAAKTLTVRLSGNGRSTLMLAHAAEPREVSNAAKVASADGRIRYSVSLKGVTEITFRF